MYEPLTPMSPPGAPIPQPTVTPPAEPVFTPAVAPRVDKPKRTVGPGLVVGAVLASALLASGGTYAVVSAAGHTSTPAPVSSTAQTPAGQNTSSTTVTNGQPA